MTMYKVNNKLKNPSKMSTEQMYSTWMCPPMTCPGPWGDNRAHEIKKQAAVVLI